MSASGMHGIDPLSGIFVLDPPGEGATPCATAHRMAYQLNDTSGRICRLRPPRHTDVLQCLAERPVLFLGTSVTRYMYLVLTHFVELGAFPHRCTSAHHADKPPTLEFGVPGPMTDERAWAEHAVLEKHTHLAPSIVKEREWAKPDTNHWQAFFNGTRALFHDHEQCFCSSSQSGRDMTPAGVPTSSLGAQCGRRHERRYYKSEDRKVELSYIVSDCGQNSEMWARRCSTCWSAAHLDRGRHAFVLLNIGLQSGWFHAPDRYAELASAAGEYLRADGEARGVWLTTNWPERAYLLGRTGGYRVRGVHENEVAMGAMANATATPTRHTRGMWGSFDVGRLDRQLRLLEASLQSRSPVRWDPFHYEPFMYEVLISLLLGQLCGRDVMRWACRDAETS